MNKIVLDFSKIKSMYNLHAYLKEAFCLPDHYGFNMDALWDCLQCSFEDETIIVRKGLDVLPADMKYAVPVLVELFEDLKKAGDIKDFVLIDDMDRELLSHYLI